MLCGRRYRGGHWYCPTSVSAFRQLTDFSYSMGFDTTKTSKRRQEQLLRLSIRAITDRESIVAPRRYTVKDILAWRRLAWGSVSARPKWIGKAWPGRSSRRRTLVSGGWYSINANLTLDLFTAGGSAIKPKKGSRNCKALDRDPWHYLPFASCICVSAISVILKVERRYISWAANMGLARNGNSNGRARGAVAPNDGELERI